MMDYEQSVRLAEKYSRKGYATVTEDLTMQQKLYNCHDDLAAKDAEIARLKGLCQDYHSEADSRDAEITKLLETVKKKTDLIVGQIELRQDADHEVIRLKQEVKDLEGKWGGEIVKAKIVKELKAQLARIQSLVDAQAEDEGLWFKPVYVTEHIFQVALRELHAAIEDK